MKIAIVNSEKQRALDKVPLMLEEEKKLRGRKDISLDEILELIQ